jgi:hypothetical protein
MSGMQHLKFIIVLNSSLTYYLLLYHSSSFYLSPPPTLQNDLQAAARAHRLGQERPVRVIRLLARHTAEEIILKRAERKLRLTDAVVERGKFDQAAGDALSAKAFRQSELKAILKFGLDNLFGDSSGGATKDAAAAAGDAETVDLQAILGATTKGRWEPLPDASVAFAAPTTGEAAAAGEGSTDIADSMGSRRGDGGDDDDVPVKSLRKNKAKAASATLPSVSDTQITITADDDDDEDTKEDKEDKVSNNDGGDKRDEHCDAAKTAATAATADDDYDDDDVPVKVIMKKKKTGKAAQVGSLSPSASLLITDDMEGSGGSGADEGEDEDIYRYMGEDYSARRKEADSKVFDTLVRERERENEAKKKKFYTSDLIFFYFCLFVGNRIFFLFSNLIRRLI